MFFCGQWHEFPYIIWENVHFDIFAFKKIYNVKKLTLKQINQLIK